MKKICNQCVLPLLFSCLLIIRKDLFFVWKNIVLYSKENWVQWQNYQIQSTMKVVNIKENTTLFISNVTQTCKFSFSLLKYALPFKNKRVAQKMNEDEWEIECSRKYQNINFSLHETRYNDFWGELNVKSKCIYNVAYLKISWLMIW